MFTSNLKRVLTGGKTLDIAINTFGNYLNAAFALFFVLILTRTLNRADYGVLNILLGIAYVLANILDFGTTATIYSTIPELIGVKRDRFFRFIKSTIWYQSIFSIIIVVLLCLSFKWLDEWFFKTGAPLWELYLTAITVLFFVWQNSILNIFFASKRFISANVILNTSNLIKTLVIFYLMFANMITIGNIIFVYGIVGPIIFFALAFWYKPKIVKSILKAPVVREDFRFSYTITNFIGMQFQSVGMRMDLFLLSFYGFKNEVGDYGLAQKVILMIISTVVSVTQVLSPAFARIKTQTEARSEFKHALLYLLIPSAIFVLLAITPNIVFELVFTQKFTETAGLTRLMGLTFVLFALIQAPLLFLLYTSKTPRYVLISHAIFFVIMTAGCFLLTPVLITLAGPLCLALGFLVIAIMQGYWSYKEYRKLAP